MRCVVRTRDRASAHAREQHPAVGRAPRRECKPARVRRRRRRRLRVENARRARSRPPVAHARRERRREQDAADWRGCWRRRCRTCAPASASGATKRDVDAVRARVGARSARSACGSMSVPATVARAELRGGDREDAGAAAVVEHALAAATTRLAQPREAQPRGRMRAGAEREPRIEREVERRGIGRRAPRRHDPEVRRRSRSARTAPASRAPSPARRPRRVSCAGTAAPSASRSVGEQRIDVGIARRTAPRRARRGHSAAAGLAGLAEDRRLGGGAGGRDRRRRPTSAPASSSASDQRVGVRRRRRRSGARRSSSAHGTRRTPFSRPPCASRASPRGSGSTCRRA